MRDHQIFDKSGRETPAIDSVEGAYAPHMDHMDPHGSLTDKGNTFVTQQLC